MSANSYVRKQLKSTEFTFESVGLSKYALRGFNNGYILLSVVCPVFLETTD